MTEHFTREEAVALAKAAGFEVRRGLGLRESVPEDVFARGLINEEVTALCNAAAVAAKLKGWDVQGAVTTQGDKAYKRGFSDGMKEAPTGESWIRAIDEAMVGAHIGVAEMADDYGTAKKKLNALICWSVQVDRDLSRAQAAQPAEPVNAELVKALKKLLEQYDELAEEDNSGWILAGELAKANHAREVLSRAQAAPAVGAPDACVWTPDTDFEMGDTYDSGCGEKWSFIDGGPAENNVRFCQGCGKPVKLAASPKIGGV